MVRSVVRGGVVTPLPYPTLLRSRTETLSVAEVTAYKTRLLKECCNAMAIVLPLTGSDLAFLEALAERGGIEPEHLTQDATLSERIRRHPALLWKALNVRQHRGVT